MSDKNEIKIEVEGKSLTLPSSDLTANKILNAAQKEGVPAAQDGAEKLYLKGDESGKSYKGEDRIDPSDDTKFSVGQGYPFVVNMQTLISDKEELVAADIIKMAREKGAISFDGKWKLLAEGGSHTFNDDELVNLVKFRNFTAILDEPTRVSMVR